MIACRSHHFAAPSQFKSSFRNNLPLDHGVSLALATEFEQALRTVSEVPRKLVSSLAPSGEVGSTYLGLVGDESQRSRDGDGIDDGGPGVTRGPLEVLVAVGVELWVVC